MTELAPSTPTFLIVRARDLVVLAVRWKDCEIRTDAHGTPVLVPIGTAATVTLTFPPQAILEQTTSLSAFTSAARVHCDSWLSGTSELVFSVSQGNAITLTAAGILQALHAIDPSSVIELPWGLRLKLSPQTSGTAMVSDHPGALIPIPGSDVVGLWHTRLRAADGTVTDARLSIHPEVAPDPTVTITQLFQTPPLFGFRDTIRRNGPTMPPRTTRLELTALGGSLSCAANWPDSSWSHTARLGRDENVQTTVLGRLWPFGHRVVYQEFIRRDSLTVQTGARPGKVACLKARRVLKILEPVRAGMRAATFPFDEVEIVGREFFINDLGDPATHQLFIPKVGTEPLRIPIRFRSGTTDIGFVIPVIFVGDGLQPASLVNDWKAFAKVDIAAVELDMIGADRRPGDVQEVHSLTLNGVADDAGFRPDLTEFEVVLPALRALLPGSAHDQRRTLKYANEIRAGVASIPDVPLRFDPSTLVGVDFTKNADRSGGLVSPKFVADGISREIGPVPTALLNPPDLTTAFNTVFAGATLFGFPLASLVATAVTVTPKPGPPTILQQQLNGATTVTFSWTGIKLQSHGPFGPRTQGSSPQLDLDVVSRPPTLAEMERLDGPKATCTLSDFMLALPPGSPLLTLSFEKVTFTQRPDVPMKLDLVKPDIQFIGELKLLQELQKKVMALLGNSGPDVRVSASEIIVSYQLRIPDAPAGMFVMRNIAVRTEVHVPFAEDPVRVIVGFASREQPFGLTVSGFGGGGYVALEIAGDTVSRLELSLEFGAMIALNFVIAKAEVHALGGVRFVTGATSGSVLEAYIRIGGSVQLLGLVTISVELRVTLRYSSSPRPKLAGEASLVIELDLTLFSQTVTVSSGTYELIGGAGPLPLAVDSVRAPEAYDAAQREVWDNYWRSFA